MPPTPCPERLRKLIERLNRELGDEARVLRLILSEVEKRRQGKGQETYVVNLQSKITISLTDYSFHIRNELADALADIDPPELIERIRYCPVCSNLFWAGTSRKKACDKHGVRVRKANNRQDIKQRKKAAATKSKKQEAAKTLDQMNRTALSVIRAVMVSKARKFSSIDGASWHDFRDDDLLPRSTLVVRRVTHKLYKDGYLTYHESAERRDRYGFSNNDYYYPTQKLIDLWGDS
ncbi:MAG TPA: hypothetical protein VJ023_01445 [Pyrinomonadaceae bacterium]|nr:hypothetical protein [Pyrinomonadaceae bacterium]